MKIVIEEIKSIILATGFLTRMPVGGRIEYSDERLAGGLRYAPLIGLVPGLAMAGTYLVSSAFFPGYLTAAFVIIAYVVSSGGLHIDGLGDLGDGLFSGRRGREFYEIMKDSRLGTGGFLLMSGVMVLDYLLLIEVNDPLLILFIPIGGRLGLLFGAVISKYPSGYEGSGRRFIDGTRISNSWHILVLIVTAFFICLSFKGLVLAVVVMVSACLFSSSWKGRLGGITGDMLGALAETSQLVFLIVAYLLS